MTDQEIEPQIDDTWEFRDKRGGIYTTTRLFYVDEHIVKWKGVAGSTISLPRKRLTALLTRGLDPRADPNCSQCQGTGGSGFWRCGCTRKDGIFKSLKPISRLYSSYSHE